MAVLSLQISMPSSKALVPTPVESRIVTLRGTKVLLDRDLAEIYGVETRVLKQAIKRNQERFPPDFIFRLTLAEAEELRQSRSQIVILKRGQNVKYAPLAFSEHGALMAASVLNSPRAVEMSVFVVRAFVRLREIAVQHTELAGKLDQLERRVSAHDTDLLQIVAAIRQLMAPPAKLRREIGFTDEQEDADLPVQ